MELSLIGMIWKKFGVIGILTIPHYSIFLIGFLHSFSDELKISPEDYHIFCTEPPLNPKPNREKSVELMFEKFNFSGM